MSILLIAVWTLVVLLVLAIYALYPPKGGQS